MRGMGVATLGLLFASAGVSVEHDPVGCLVGGGFPVLGARLVPPEDVARARVYFRAADTQPWYYVEMKPGVEGAAFEGVLPSPKADAGAVEYYLQVLDRGFGESRTAEYRARVAGESEGCDPTLTTAGVLASVPGLLLGVPAGAPAVPLGFASAGIVGAAAGTTAAGAATAGSSGGGATAAGGAGAAAAGGGASTALIVGGVAAAGAAVGVAASGGGGDGGDVGGGAQTQPGGGAAPQPTPDPTPDPADAVNGRWVGNAVDDPRPDECTIENDFVFDITRSGSSLGGTYTVTVRATRSAPQDPCTEQPGDVASGTLTGSISGDAVSIRLSIWESEVLATGTIAGNRMSGRYEDSDGPGGAWDATRQ